MGDPATSDRLEPGALLVGRYRVVRLLGHGGMAYVYEGEHLRLRRPVAIKVLRREFASAPDVARFEREGRALATMTSRYVTRVLDVDTTPAGSVFLVMELLEGHPLDVELANRGPLPVGDATRFIVQACEGLAEAHELGIVHRDVKPSNLFLARDAGERIVKVIDFGISKAPNVEDAKLTTTEHLIGTPLYMAPEQFASPRAVDARADIWSLGSTLYELLTGRAPHQGSGATVAYAIATEPPPRLEVLRPDAPREVAAVIARTLQREPDARFASARELARALGPFATPDAHDGKQVISFAAGKSGAPPVRPDALTQRAEVPTQSAGAMSQPDASEARVGTKQARSRKPWRAGVLAVAAVIVLGAAWLAIRGTPNGKERSVEITETPSASAAPPTPAPTPPTPPSPPASTSTPALSASAPPPRPASPHAPSPQPRAHPSTPSSAPTAPTHPPIFFPQ